MTHVISASAFAHVFGAAEQLLLVARAKPAQQESANKARNKAAAAQRLCRCKTSCRQRDDRNLHPMLADPAAPLSKPQHYGGQPSQRQADHQPDTNRLDDDPGDMRHRPAFNLSTNRQSEQQHDNWHADAVVEAAFQIEGFARCRRHRRIRHDRFTERCVSGCQHRGEQGHFQNLEPGEDDGGDEKTEHDRQGQTDEQKPLREAEVAFDNAKIGVGGIGEQNHRERQFRQKP